jgi:hypothetical protein
LVFLNCQRLDLRKPALLIGIIRRQHAKLRLVLVRARSGRVMQLEIGFISGQHEPAPVRFRARYCNQQFVESLQNLVGVPHPSVMSSGREKVVIRERADEAESRNR